MYSFSVTLAGDFDAVVEKVTATLAENGFGIITQIDVQATMKAKLGLEQAPYKILGACNPGLANRVMQADPDAGLLLPCNVVVREAAAGEVVVAFMDPEAVVGLSDNADVKLLAAEVKPMLQSVVDGLK